MGPTPTKSNIAVTSAKSFFDKLYSDNRVKPSDNAKAVNDNFIQRSSNNSEQVMALRKIQSNTETIVELLKKQSLNGKDKDKSLLSSLLPLLAGSIGPVIAGLIPAIIAASNPEKHKASLTALRHAPKAANAGADIIASSAKLAHTIGGAGKVLGKIGGLSDNKYFKAVNRMSSVGLAAGRYYQGDTLGGTAELASLGLSEASSKVKSPRAKLALLLASLGTDAGLIVRDYINSDSGQNSSGSGSAIAGGAALAGAAVLGGKKFATPNMQSFASTQPVTSAGGSLGSLGKAGSVAKFGMKGAGKLLPGVGLALGTYGAYSRASDGDYVGAIAEGVSGIISLLPGLGTAGAALIQGGLFARDMMKESNANSDRRLNQSTNMVKENTAAITEQMNAVNGSITKNAAETSTIVKQSNSSLMSFTKTLGSELIGWLSKTTSFFTGAFASLAVTSSNVLDAIKNSSFGQGISDFFGFGKDNSSSVLKKLKDGNIKGMHTGVVSEMFESGGRGVGTVSSGIGDHGGVSYGKHQFTANTMNKFLSSNRGKQFAGQFAGLKAGSSAFNSKYKQVAGNDNGSFEAAQRAFVYDTYVTPANAQILKKTGMDIMGSRGRALKELLLSTAVQYGVHNAVTMFTHPGVVGNNPSRVSDAGLIKAIQDYKSKTVGRHFKSSSAAVKQGVADRIKTEKSVLLSIDSKVGGSTGHETVAGNAATRSIEKQAAGMLPAGAGVLKPGAALDPSRHKGSNVQPGTGVLKPEVLEKNKASAKTSTSSSKKNTVTGNTFDLDKVVSSAYASAKGRKSTGQCAEYVRKAIEAGYKKVGGLGHAKDYHKSLPKIGWKSVGNNITNWAKGDISVFTSTGSDSGKKYGHVAIWSGSIWISDFIQPSVQPNQSLGTFPYTVYRAIHGTSNGSAVGGLSDADAIAGGALVGASDTVGADVSANQTDVLGQAMDAAVSSVASLASAFGNLDVVKDAVSFVNKATVDEWKGRKVDPVDMTGFKKLDTREQASYKYAFGEGGGIDEDVLFNPNLDRQYKTSTDILGNAGYIPGVVRQEKSYNDILGNAGHIPGIVRQNSYGSKSKWYQRLFSGSNSDFYGAMASALGLGDIYGLGRDITNAKQSGNLTNYGLTKFAEIGNNAVLQANTKDRDMVDGYISSMNNQHNTMKMNMMSSSNASMPNIPDSLPATGHMKGNGNIDGMSAALVTRNPDTIFREVCINMMKTSTS